MFKFISGSILGLFIGFFAKDALINDSSTPILEPVTINENIKPIDNPNSIHVKGKSKVGFFKTKNNANSKNDYIFETLERINSATDAEAYSLYRDLYNTYPRSELILEQYSDFLLKNEQWEEAEEVLKNCLKKFSQSELCYASFVNLIERTKGKDQQLQAIKSCLNALPNNVSCLNSLANYSLRFGHFSKALELFSKMSRVNGQGRITFQERTINWGIALSYRGLGNTERAVEFLNRSCQDSYQQACDLLIQLDQEN